MAEAAVGHRPYAVDRATESSRTNGLPPASPVPPGPAHHGRWGPVDDATVVTADTGPTPRRAGDRLRTTIDRDTDLGFWSRPHSQETHR